MANHVIGGRTEYYLSNRDGDPTWDQSPGNNWQEQQIVQWLSSLGDPNFLSGACDLYESVGADPILQDQFGQRYPTAQDNVDPYLALVAVGKTNIQGYDVPIWYRTFFVFTQNPETPNARQIVGSKQGFWLPNQPAVFDYSWGTETPDWIGLGVSGDGLKAGSNVGQLFLDQHLSGVGNIVILADPGFGPPDEPLEDLYDLELDGGDVPIAPYQLIAVSRHDPFGDCWTQTRLYTLPANAKNPNRVGNYGMVWAGWIERVWANDGGDPLYSNQWGLSNRGQSHSFTGIWWKPGTKWGPSRMDLHFVPRTELQWSGWSVLPGGNTTTQAGDAAVVYRDKLYLFGIGKVHHQHWLKTFDGTNWSGWSQVPGSGTTRMADAAAVFQDKLYLFAVALADNSQQVNVFDGANWAGWSAVPGGATLGSIDVAVVYDGQLWLLACAPRDAQNRTNLKMNRFDGANWAGWSDVPGSVKTTSDSFAAAVYANKLYLFAPDQQDLPIFTTFDGNAWAAWSRVGSDWVDWTEVINGIQYEVSVEIFDAVSDGGNLYVFTTGIVSEVNSNAPPKLRVYLNVFDGNQWIGWNALPGEDFPLGTSTNTAAVYAGKLYLFGIIGGVDHLNILSV
jgi:hypothetical protein